MTQNPEAESRPQAEQQQAPRHPARGEQHAQAPNPEQHLMEAHKLSIQVQGKEAFGGYATWALVREERGKTKTLRVYNGTRHEAVMRFYSYLHPQKEVVAPPARRAGGPRPPRPSTGGPRRGGRRS